MPGLIREGKYHDGKKVAPVRVALPFQTHDLGPGRLSDPQGLFGL